MLDLKRHDFISEYYEVEKTIEIVARIGGDTKTIRIEALKSDQRGEVRYHTRGWVQEAVTLQPTYPQSRGVFDRKPESMRIWVSYDIPWTDCRNAEDALTEAVSLLSLQRP